MKKSPTPHGVGGLKYEFEQKYYKAQYVPPLTGWVD